jgi:hypothetical protein
MLFIYAEKAYCKLQNGRISLIMSEQKVSKQKKGGHISHGIYAREMLLPWEDSEEFAGLHDELKKEFFPRGVSEEECVLDLAQIYWQKRTLWRLRTATVLRDRFTEEIIATGKKSWPGIRNGLRVKAREEHTLMQSIETTAVDGVSEMARAVRKLAKDPNAEEVEKLGPALSAGVDLIRKIVMPLLDEVRQLPNAEAAFDKNYLPENLEKIARLEMAMDVRITKVMARLVALKEFKRTPAGSPLAQVTAARPIDVTREPKK